MPDRNTVGGSALSFLDSLLRILMPGWPGRVAAPDSGGNISANKLTGRDRQRIDTPLHNSVRRMILENKEHLHNPFFILIRYLTDLDEQIAGVAPVSCAEYENYFRKNFLPGNFPLAIDPVSVKKQEDIIQFIDSYDRAHLWKMVSHVFIGLIGFLVSRRGKISLLDFGSGHTCGMYGENGRFLFTGKHVDTDAVTFWAIDELHEPSGAIFQKANYLKSNILSFNPGEKFDLITGHHVLEHCCDWQDVIEHVAGLLKEDGYLYLSFPRFGGFYDSVYRLISPHDHCADFSLETLKSTAGKNGLKECLVDVYVDPNGKFDWIPSIYPGLVSKQMSDCFYDLCIAIDSKLLIGYHHYGYYVVFRKTS
ncbi:MAG: methyltransferase domain-containing protein [Thermodesulfovibrionales bacterium]|nr:methyltransferase domain-containing protein [Thermodesulfovibrionales bacterium]